MKHDKKDRRFIVLSSPFVEVYGKNTAVVAFNRQELNMILRYYGQMVAAGKWRDYAIDHLEDRAVFSIFQHACEGALFRIEKNPQLTKRQGAFSITAMNGYRLKRGHDLAQILRIFDKYLLKLL